MSVFYSFIPITDKVQIYKKRKDNEKQPLRSKYANEKSNKKSKINVITNRILMISL